MLGCSLHRDLAGDAAGFREGPRPAMICLKRAYDAPAEADGIRFLVDRLWPRGIKKQDLRIEAWLRDVAPSNDLRRWFGHDPDRWQAFKQRYFVELGEKAEALAPLRDAAREGDVTLIYSAKDTEHNNAVALREYLESRARG
jgi:uncharacterized protein YeaO (DUF488 family)